MRLACSFWKLHSVFLQMFLWSPLFRAQSPELSARSLDSLLQDYAFRAFLPPKTGIPYNGRVPSNLTGIKVSALRLRSGSLRKRGFSSFKEFNIPIGVVEQPYVKRLVLVYHNLQNWSSLYYPLPGFTYLAPVLGLLAYDASNLSASDLSELDIRASQNPILITFFNASFGMSPKCVYFGLDGSVEFNNVMVGNVCSTSKQGHFSIVVESAALPPAPGGENPPPSAGGGGEKVDYKMWTRIGFGVLALLVALGMLVVWVKRCRRRKRIQIMQQTAESGITLRMTTIGNSKAPMALATRTRPLLENEHVN